MQLHLIDNTQKTTQQSFGTDQHIRIRRGTFEVGDHLGDVGLHLVKAGDIQGSLGFRGEGGGSKCVNEI